ncbi:MAG: DUF6597 domain-containing transcriptional factor [Sphingopyxis sp.]
MSTMVRSRNYAPSADLASVVARFYVVTVPLADDFEVIDRLFSETAFVRILMGGDWAWESAPGQWQAVEPMLLCGQSTRPITARVRGSFHVVGFALRPGGWRRLFAAPANTSTDRLQSLAPIWGDAAHQLFARLNCMDRQDDAPVIALVEQFLRTRIAERGDVPHDPAMQAFEHLVRRDSTMLIRDTEAMIGLSARQMERACAASFGLTPKTIMRRSRFLDMAAAMRGFTNPSEDELARLRFYDQSHLNREFRRFIEMTPKQFANTPTPLLDAGMVLRAMRKGEEMAKEADRVRISPAAGSIVRRA